MVRIHPGQPNKTKGLIERSGLLFYLVRLAGRIAPSTPTLRSKVGVRLVYLHIPAPVGAPPWTPRGLLRLMGCEGRCAPLGPVGRQMALAIAGGDALRLPGDGMNATNGRRIEEQNRGHGHRERRHRPAEGLRGCRPAAGTTDQNPQAPAPFCPALPMCTSQLSRVGAGGLAGP